MRFKDAVDAVCNFFVQWHRDNLNSFKLEDLTDLEPLSSIWDMMGWPTGKKPTNKNIHPVDSSKLSESILPFTIFLALVMTIWIVCHYTSPYTLVKNCRVIFDWTEPKRVGDSVRFSITCYQVNGAPHPVEQLAELIQNLSVTIHLDSETIPSKSTVDEENNFIYVQFVVAVSGTYKIELMYRNFSINGSPFFRTFMPGVVDPSKSNIVKPAHSLIVLTEWENNRVQLNMLDKFGNVCRIQDVDLKKFQFFVSLDEENPHVEDTDVLQDFIVNFDASSGEDGDDAEDNIFMHIKSKHQGIFNGKVEYNGILLHNGFFSMVVITVREQQIIHRVLNDKSVNYSNVKAKIIAVGDEHRAEVQDVYVNMTPISLSIHEIVWSILTSKLATYEICSRTKIRMVTISPLKAVYQFTVSDGVQKSLLLEMDWRDARIIFVLFAHFTSLRTGRLIYFEDKEKFFNENLKKLIPASRFTMNVIQVSRQSIVKTTFQETELYDTSDWRKSFLVSFKGEKVNESDRVVDWLCELCSILFENNSAAMFSAIGNSRLVHPNPSTSRNQRWKTEYYQLAGKVVAKCLIEAAVNKSYQRIIKGRFTRSFLAQVLGLPVTYMHFEQDDPDLYLSTIVNILEKDVEVMTLTFIDLEYGDDGNLSKKVHLVPNGHRRPVTNDNKEEYLNALANRRLSVLVKDEIEAFRYGLLCIIPEALLTIFDANELELLICGNPAFDLEDMKRNCPMSDQGQLDFSPAHHSRVMDWFWTTISNMSEEEKSRLIQFTTGSCMLPPGGFKELRPPFRIALSCTFGQLPVAHKHLHQISLSDHHSLQEFSMALIKAISQESDT